MKKPMQLSLLALLLSAAFTPVAHAAPAEEPRPIFVRLKAETPDPALRSGVNPERQQSMDALKRLSPSMRPLINVSPMARNAENVAALERHNLTRYYTIPAEALVGMDAEALVKQLLSNPLVESAQIEPVPVVTSDKAEMAVSRARSVGNIPNYADCSGTYAYFCQNYMGSPEPSNSWKLGGVNAFEAQRLTGHYGENVRVISNENLYWDPNHIDLPKPFLLHWNPWREPGSHNTRTAGIMFGQDNGFGVTGVVPKAQAGFTRFEAEGMVDLRNVLSAGDVVQIGVQYWMGQGCGPGKGCHLPVEHMDVVQDAIAYLVQEKGVHVILLAANGDVNLDDPYFNGRYDRNVRDTGSIFVAAADPWTGGRADFSEYGSRIDVFSWGYEVTTTDWEPGRHDLYTTAYNGTSSANPVIAGGVAWLQSLARERGLGNIPPLTMRQIMVDSGNPPPVVDPRRNIGVQPDLVRAMELLGTDVDEAPLPVAQLTGPAEVLGGETVTFSAEASTGKGLTYEWSSQPGLAFTTQGAQASIIAPESEQDVAYRIAVKVTDAQGRSASTSLAVLVKANLEPAPIPAPVAQLTGPTQAQAGETVTFSAAKSTGKDLTYDWSSQPALNFVKQGAEASVVAPDIEKDASYRINVKVTDSQGRSATSQHTVLFKAKPATGGGDVCTSAPAWDSKRTYNVSNEAVSYKGKLYRQNFWNVNAAPDVNSAPWGQPWKSPEDCAPDETPIPAPVAKISGPAEAKAQERVVLSASGSTGQGLKFEWSSNDMPIQGSGNTASFTAPSLAQDRDMTFKVTVTDERGRSATASHVVKVKAKEPIPEVIAPEAKLSGPSTVKGGDRVTLSGKASVGTDLRYRWKAPSGISTSALDQAELSFVAPAATKDTPYQFTLTVSNSRGEAQATHTVTVTGQPAVGGHPQYQPGATYQFGDKVTNGGKTYECKPWPYGGWCSQSPAHYAPGTGSHWQDAWILR